MTGVMNFDTHGLQRTWPHGTASTAFEELERAFRHEGQDRTRALVCGSGSSVNIMVVKVFNEIECGDASLEDGHRGFNLGVLVMVWVALVAVVKSGV
jgi:hypothetical protein